MIAMMTMAPRRINRWINFGENCARVKFELEKGEGENEAKYDEYCLGGAGRLKRLNFKAK